jgi:hypothetical protein
MLRISAALKCYEIIICKFLKRSDEQYTNLLLGATIQTTASPIEMPPLGAPFQVAVTTVVQDMIPSLVQLAVDKADVNGLGHGTHSMIIVGNSHICLS